MARRRFLAQLAAWPLAALLPGSALASAAGGAAQDPAEECLGSDDPTKAAFPRQLGRQVRQPKDFRVAGRVADRIITE